jgi:hypothetical protein
MNLHYAWFALFRHGHPDAEVRSVCGRAAARLESATFLGLRPLLTSLHAERLCARRRMIFHAIFGDDAPEAPELCLQPDQGGRYAAVMAWAREYLSPAKSE